MVSAIAVVRTTVAGIGIVRTIVSAVGIERIVFAIGIVGTIPSYLSLSTVDREP
jgi:hypothetical protein